MTRRGATAARPSRSCAEGRRALDLRRDSNRLATAARQSTRLAERRATRGPGLLGARCRRSLEAWFAERGEPAYRARQVADAVWGGQATSAAEIRTMPAALRAELDDGLPLRHGRRHGDPPGRRRPDREGPPPPVGRRPRRVGPHALSGARGAARAAHAVHLEPGRLRRRLPVLRDRRARLHARPRDRRDRRPGPPRRAPARRRREAPDERRVHGHGRAAAQPRPGPRGRRRAERPAAVRARGAPHHGLDVRRRAGHPAADGARAAVHAGGLAPRGARRAARRPRAAQPALADRRGRRGRARPRHARPAGG